MPQGRVRIFQEEAEFLGGGSHHLVPRSALLQHVAAIVSSEAETVCREQRHQETCAKVLNDSLEQGRGQHFTHGVLQKQARGCKKNLALNTKECREKGLPISFACLLPKTQALSHPHLFTMSQEAMETVPQSSRNL